MVNRKTETKAGLLGARIFKKVGAAVGRREGRPSREALVDDRIPDEDDSPAPNENSPAPTEPGCLG